MTLEDEIEQIVNECSKNFSINDQKILYKNIKKLASLFIYKMYPLLRSDGIDSIGHEVASDIMMSLSRGSIAVYAWGNYIRNATQRVAADWMRLNLYSPYQSVDDIEKYGLEVLWKPNSISAEILIEVSTNLDLCKKNIFKILNSIGMYGAKGALMKRIIMEYAQGKEDYLAFIPYKFHGKIRLLAYLIKVEVNKFATRISEQY